MSMSTEFSVCQFFKDGEYEYTRRWVTIAEAWAAFEHYTASVAARIGMVTRVIITDGGDCIVAEWRYGLGITWLAKGEIDESQKSKAKEKPHKRKNSSASKADRDPTQEEVEGSSG